MRAGIGYDIHRLVDGRALVLGGVSIDYRGKGLLGHSDGDVLLHAIADAILGALAMGDIGQHFPDTDPRYRGISSLKLLHEVARITSHKGSIYNVDATVVCEEPKLAPHIVKMRKEVAGALDIPVERISIKATTNEGMGPEGRGEGISAYAVVLVEDFEDEDSA
jgi:2-C-methyl-D-erythritol 2,4-cyclodiphosphate synthase